MRHDKIIVLDFGSQYNQLIARRIRDFNVFSQLLPYHTTAEEIKALGDVKGIIFSGGPNSVYEEGSFRCDPAIFDLGVPVLGVCYGMQLISYLFEGTIEPGLVKEYGGQAIYLKKDSPLFKGTPQEQEVWMSHGDHVSKLPKGFELIAESSNGICAAIMNEERQIYGVQFHPEVRNSQYGLDLIHNFVFEICKAEANWNMESYISDKVKEIQETVGKEKVLLGISGGVDSSVAAVLIHKAIGNQLTCMFIDHGLLRKNEGDQVMETFAKYGIEVIRIDAKERFLTLLKGVTEPEQKRKIIGNTFVRCFDEESKKFGDYAFLGQGTLYTDVIESGTKTAQTIKSHHNVGGLPKDMKFKLLEPLNVLFKDEVRKLGKALGMADELVYRQPFPGPGLGIRIIGDITEEKIKVVQDTDWILREEFHKAGLDKSVWQYFTVCTGIKSVGVMGDQRTYSYVIAIRAITSIDGMTADWAKIPYEVLDTCSRRMINEVPGCNRICYDITSKPPATIEWE